MQRFGGVGAGREALSLSRFPPFLVELEVDKSAFCHVADVFKGIGKDGFAAFLDLGFAQVLPCFFKGEFPVAAAFVIGEIKLHVFALRSFWCVYINSETHIYQVNCASYTTQR